MSRHAPPTMPPTTPTAPPASVHLYSQRPLPPLPDQRTLPPLPPRRSRSLSSLPSLSINLSTPPRTLFPGRSTASPSASPQSSAPSSPSSSRSTSPSLPSSPSSPGPYTNLPNSLIYSPTTSQRTRRRRVSRPPSSLSLGPLEAVREAEDVVETSDRAEALLMSVKGLGSSLELAESNAEAREGSVQAMMADMALRAERRAAVLARARAALGE